MKVEFSKEEYAIVRYFSDNEKNFFKSIIHDHWELILFENGLRNTTDINISMLIMQFGKLELYAIRITKDKIQLLAKFSPYEKNRSFNLSFEISTLDYIFVEHLK